MNFIFDNDRPIYTQIVEQFEQFIASGQLKAGEKLQSVRELATLVKVNPNTMQKALQELENKNLIYTERTNGKYVTKYESLIKRYREKYAKEKALSYLDNMKKLGYSKQEAYEYLKEIGGNTDGIT